MIIKVLILSPSPEQREFLMHASLAHVDSAVFTTEDCLCSGRECSDGPCCDTMIVGDRGGISGLEFIKALEARGCHCPPRRRGVLVLSPHGSEIRQASDLGVKVFAPPLRESEFRQWLQECRSEVSATSCSVEGTRGTAQGGQSVY